jgi:hypothetical protein
MTMLFSCRNKISIEIAKSLYSFVGWLSATLMFLIIGYYFIHEDISKLSDMSPVFVVLSALLMFSLANYLENFKKEEIRIKESIKSNQRKQINLENVINNIENTKQALNTRKEFIKKNSNQIKEIANINYSFWEEKKYSLELLLNLDKKERALIPKILSYFYELNETISRFNKQKGNLQEGELSMFLDMISELERDIELIFNKIMEEKSYYDSKLKFINDRKFC